MDQEKFTEDSLLKNTQITSNFLKPVFRKFCMVHSQIPSHIQVQMKVISQAVLELKTVSLEFKIYETAEANIRPVVYYSWVNSRKSTGLG